MMVGLMAVHLALPMVDVMVKRKVANLVFGLVDGWVGHLAGRLGAYLVVEKDVLMVASMVAPTVEC